MRIASACHASVFLYGGQDRKANFKAAVVSKERKNFSNKA